MSEPTPKRRGNPAMQAGAPSLNPAGRGVSKSFSSAKKPGIGQPAGSDGVSAPGGYLITGERNSKLTGDQKWVTYDNLLAGQTAIVASAVRIWLDLGGSAKWKTEPNPLGGADAERCAELVTEGLLENPRLSKPWRNVVKRQLMKKFRGFALHEAIPKRRADGLIVFGDLQHRPQYTVNRWDKVDEREPWQAIEQRTRAGGTYIVPRERLFYSVEDTLTDSPDGIGLFRHLVEVARVLERYLQLEGIGFDNDMRGIPVARAPLQKIAEEAVTAGGVAKNDPAGIASYVDAKIKALKTLAESHVVTKDRSLLLDSLPYFSKAVDGSESPSSIYEWSFDTMHTQISGMPELGAAIARCNVEMARVMCAEWLLLGAADSGGAYSMHENKTEMFALVVNATLDDIADDATRDLAARLVALNGYDPETCTPMLQHEPIARQGIEAAARTLVLLSQAGMRRGDEAGNILRGRMDLPPAPELDESDLMAPRGRALPGHDDDEIDPTESPDEDPDELATPKKD